MTRNLIHLHTPPRQQHAIAFGLLWALGLGWFVIAPPPRSGCAAEPAADGPALLKPTRLAAWGTEALTQIRKDLLQPGNGLYAEYGSPDGSMKETGQWGGDDFSDAWLELYGVDKDAGWLAAVHGMLKFLHEKGRDKHGRHGEHWDQDVSGQALAKFQLLYMAPATRAYWMAAAVKPAGS